MTEQGVRERAEKILFAVRDASDVLGVKVEDAIAAIVPLLVEFRKEVLESAAFDLWRNSGAPPITSAKTARARDREHALEYLRRLAREGEK